MVIILLILISLGFFFTLGLHYGKKLHAGDATKEVVAGKLEESPDVVPAKDILENGAQHSDVGTQETVKTATQEELANGGLKVDQPKPVDLPNEKVKEKSGEKTEPKKAEVKKPAEESKSEDSESEDSAAHGAGKFAIQLGSYPSKKEAEAKIKGLVKRGLHPGVRTAEVNHQTRFRVVLPGFKTKALADAKGKELHGKKKIENFIVIKSE